MSGTEQLDAKHRQAEDQSTAGELVALASFRRTNLIPIGIEMPMNANQSLAMQPNERMRKNSSYVVHLIV